MKYVKNTKSNFVFDFAILHKTFLSYLEYSMQS